MGKPFALDLIGNDSEGVTDSHRSISRARSILLWVEPCYRPSMLGENKHRGGSNHDGGGDGDGGGGGDGDGGGDGGDNHRGSSPNFLVHNLHRGVIVDCAFFNIKTFHRDKP